MIEVKGFEKIWSVLLKCKKKPYYVHKCRCEEIETVRYDFF